MPVNDINRPCSSHGRGHLKACQDVEWHGICSSLPALLNCLVLVLSRVHFAAAWPVYHAAKVQKMSGSKPTPQEAESTRGVDIRIGKRAPKSTNIKFSDVLSLITGRGATAVDFVDFSNCVAVIGCHWCGVWLCFMQSASKSARRHPNVSVQLLGESQNTLASWLVSALASRLCCTEKARTSNRIPAEVYT